MDPPQRYKTRSRKDEDQSPLRSLDDISSRRQKKLAPSRAKRATKSKFSIAIDGADAQSHQPEPVSTQHVTTSPSQSPQPESHSEQDGAPESRSTSPPEQNELTRRKTRSGTRSASPSHTLDMNGTEAKPKVDGKKGKAVSRPRVNSKGASTHRGVGTSKVHGGKCGYTHMADAEDADAEDAGDERQLSKRNKYHAQDPQLDIEQTQSDVSQPVHNSRNRQDVHTRQRVQSSSDEDSAANRRPTKRSRNHTEAKSSIDHNTHRRSPLSTFRSNYQKSVLKSTPSPANPFATTGALIRFGSSPEVESPIQNQSVILSSLAPSNQEPSPNSRSIAGTPSCKPSALVSESVHNSPSAVEGSSRKSSSVILNHDSTVAASANGTSSSKPRAGDVGGQQPNRFDSTSNSRQVAHQSTSSHISNDDIAGNTHATKAHNRPSTSAEVSSDNVTRNIHATEAHTRQNNFTSAETTPAILPMDGPSPFIFPVSSRLPPKPPRRNTSTLPAGQLSIATISETETEPDDEYFGLYKDDGDEGLDQEAKRLKLKAKKKLDKETLQQYKALKADMQRINLAKKDFDEKLEEAKRKVVATGELDLSFAPLSRPTEKHKSKETSLLVFPASGSLLRIEVTNPKIIGMLRAIHDHFFADGAQISIPDASEVAALLKNIASKRPSVALLNGQKATNQLENDAFSDHDSGDESDGWGNPSASYIDGADDDTTVISGKGEVTPTPTTPAKSGWLSTIKSAVMTPFTFKGKASTADVPQTEFTYSHTHKIQEQSTPTRSGRKIASSTERRPQSERRPRTQPPRAKGRRSMHHRKAQPTLAASVDPEEEERRRMTIALESAKEYNLELMQKRGEKPTPEWYLQYTYEYWKADRDAFLAKEEAKRKAKEFADLTSKARAQSRETRNVEVHADEHKHPGTFTVPDSDDEGETEIDVTLAAPIAPPDPPPAPAQVALVASPVTAHSQPTYSSTKGWLGFSYDPRDPTYCGEASDDEDDSILKDNSTTTTIPQQPTAQLDEAPATTSQQPSEAPPSAAQQSAESTSILQPRQWNQTPPPKPRPGNAQLPQQVNKYIPKKPSGLRHVQAMSPIHREDGGEKERRQAVLDGRMSIQEYLASFEDELTVWGKESHILEAVVVAGLCPPHILVAVNRAMQ